MTSFPQLTPALGSIAPVTALAPATASSFEFASLLGAFEQENSQDAEQGQPQQEERVPEVPAASIPSATLNENAPSMYRWNVAAHTPAPASVADPSAEPEAQAAYHDEAGRRDAALPVQLGAPSSADMTAPTPEYPAPVAQSGEDAATNAHVRIVNRMPGIIVDHGPGYREVMPVIPAPSGFKDVMPRLDAPKPHHEPSNDRVATNSLDAASVLAGPITSKLPAPIVTPPAASPTAHQQFVLQVTSPIRELAAGPEGVRTIKLRLHPEELGAVEITAHVSKTGTRLEIAGLSEAAREAVKAVLPDLRRDLAQHQPGARLDMSSERESGQHGQTRQERHDQPAPAKQHMVIAERAPSAATEANEPPHLDVSA